MCVCVRENIEREVDTHGYLSIYLSVYLSICLSVCLSIYLSLSLSLSVCLSVWLAIHPSLENEAILRDLHIF